jgi:uncharacterized protein YneR
MEKIIDSDQLLIDFSVPEPEYMALFDPLGGSVYSVGPSHAFADKPNKITIDRETAEFIIEGKILLSNCFVDLTSNTLEIAEIKSVNKIDDVLHRITEKQHVDFEKPDVYITYNRKKKTMKFELTEELSGTKKLAKKVQPIKKRKIFWDGETKMDFLLTDYNDPNILYEMLSITLSDIISNRSKTISNIDAPKNFSLYTRRIFKNYLIDIK